MRLPAPLLLAALATAPALAADPLGPPPMPPVEAPRPTTATTTAAAEPAPRLPALRVSVGPRALHRSLSWNLTGTSRWPSPDYSMPAALGMGVGATWFPGAHFTTGAIANVGLYLDGTFGLGLASTVGANTWGTHTQRLRGGLLVRVPLGKHELNFNGGLLTHAFDIDPTSTTGAARPQLPNVDLTGVRAGVGARLCAGPVTVTLDLSGVVGLAYGELSSAAWYPNTSGGGLDAALGLTIPLVENIELKLDAELTHYFLSLNVPATVAASGSDDQHLGAGAALVWVM